MDRVDEMSQDIVKYNTYLRNTSKQQQQKHQVGFQGQAVARWVKASYYVASVIACKLQGLYIASPKYIPIQKANLPLLEIHYVQTLCCYSF